MGLNIGFSSCSHDRPEDRVVYVASQRPNPNPNKYRWVLQSIRDYMNGWCVVVIKYTDCTNYEGKKVLVYDNYAKFHSLMATGAIDPHFSESDYSPVARFEPTDRGIQLANAMASHAHIPVDWVGQLA